MTMASAVATLGGAAASVPKAGMRQMKPEEWTNRILQQLKSMQDALSVLYNGIETQSDEGPIVSDGDRENSSFTSDEYTLPQLAHIFSQYCWSICALLSAPSNGQVKLPLSSLMNVISRCLRVSYADVKSVPSMTKLAELLPVIHQSALDTISQLVSSCKTNLLPHSRAITDLCLQGLASSIHMDNPGKSKTRACAYRALGLVVKTFGWGRYLTRQSKPITQDLIADIKWQDTLKQAPSATTDHNKQDIDLGRHKKGKKKKKNKAESYSDLAVTDPQTGAHSSDDVSHTVEATLGALELSKLVLEREGFSNTENLVRSILDTTVTLQCQGPSLVSPYREMRCRKGLYSAVCACVTVKLEPGCSRKDSVTHFQMSNLALNLLNDGLHLDSSQEVHQECQQALSIIRLTGNLNRPIIRRILPDENNDTRDAMELEREILKLDDEKENLKKRLLESELETQSQGRLLASLRQEIEGLRALASKKEDSLVRSDPEVRSLEMEASKESLQSTSSEDEEEENDDGAKDGVKDVQGANTAEKDKAERFSEKGVSGSQTKEASEASISVVKSNGNSAMTLSNPTETGKRKCVPDADTKSSVKKKKLDVDRSNNNATDEVPVASSSKVVREDDSDGEDIQAMISDFVDTEPDLL